MDADVNVDVDADVGVNANVAKYDLNRHLEQYKEHGFTIFADVYDSDTLEKWKVKYNELLEGSYAIPGRDWWFANCCESAPRLMLPVAANPLILDFMEMAMGPYVQLDNLILAGFPSVPKEQAAGKVTGWHRDRWAGMPGNDYQPPLAANAVCYMQDLTDESGPLRVIPGSHRQPVSIAKDERTSPHPQEWVIYVKAGDVVVLHNRILHTGTPNTTGQARYFCSSSYCKSWIKQIANHSGPNVQRIIAEARSRNDRRLLRLFGVDDFHYKRSNLGFQEADEQMWSELIAEDRAAMQQ